MDRGGRWLAPLLVWLATACANADSGNRPEVRIDTIGDTISVHTLAGGAWAGAARLVEEVRIGTLEGRDEEMLGSVSGLAVGRAGEIYVYDRQVPALRHYSADGTFVATLGSQGNGPGEYANSDGGLAVLPDGRIVLRDPGNARFTLWQSDGTYDSEWLGRGGFFTSTPLFVDLEGHVYTTVIRNARDGERVSPGSLWVVRLLRIAPDGTPVDTLDLPDYAYEAPVLVAQQGGGTSMNTVPFSAGFHWTMDPHGRFIAGTGNRYAVDIHRTDGSVFRVGRQLEPVPVTADEKSAAEEAATWSMRRTQETWRWNGPPIPDTKPLFRDIIAAGDGRIWVQLSAPGERLPEEATPRDPQRPPPARYREPVIFDIFEPDGRYLGMVSAPAGFMTYPKPVFRRDTVWAVVRDEMDVNYVVRFRVVADVE